MNGSVLGSDSPNSFSGFPPSNVSPLGSPCPSPPVQGTPVSSPTTKTCLVQLPETAGLQSERTAGSVAAKSHHRVLTHSQSAPSSTTPHWRPPPLCGRYLHCCYISLSLQKTPLKKPCLSQLKAQNLLSDQRGR